jgi:hypothetical protein
MNITRGFFALGAVLTVLVGLLCLFPGTTRRLGLDFWSIPDLTLELQQDEADRIELDRQSKRDIGRVTAKAGAAQEVMEGRLTLWQAAALFRVLEADEQALNRRIRARRYPAATDEERCCREVIGWVAAKEEKQPEGGQGVARRLTAELEDALRRDRLSLPDPAPAAYPDQGRTPPGGGAAGAAGRGPAPGPAACPESSTPPGSSSPGA